MSKYLVTNKMRNGQTLRITDAEREFIIPMKSWEVINGRSALKVLLDEISPDVQDFVHKCAASSYVMFFDAHFGDYALHSCFLDKYEEASMQLIIRTLD